ncbi:MAG: hypothetical protein M0D55_02760 [Elusimicrobiota bacterium]|nr:MAG: hypothetical protein M0D55_02760 [Elusimicrobiota bacterium]
MREALLRLRRRMLETGSPLLDGHFSAVARAESVTLDTRVSVRPGPLPLVSMKNGRATIDFSGNSLSGPTRIWPALKFVARTPRFSAKQLPRGMSGAAKLTLVKRLIREGLLKP